MATDIAQRLSASKARGCVPAAGSALTGLAGAVVSFLSVVLRFKVTREYPRWFLRGLIMMVLELNVYEGFPRAITLCAKVMCRA